MPAKKVSKLSMRKPPKRKQKDKDIERFVTQESNGSDDTSSNRSKSSSIIYRKRTGDERRRTTLYLPPDLVYRLKRYCLDTDQDMSEAVRKIVESHLETAMQNG